MMTAPAIKLLRREGDSSPALHLPKGAQEALRQLHGDGVSERELIDRVMTNEGAAGLPLLYFALNGLAERGLLSYQVIGDRGPLATAPVTLPLLHFDQQPFEVRGVHVFSRSALIRREGERMVIETARSSVRITIHDSRALTFIMRPDSASGLSPDEVSVFGSFLKAYEILVEDDEDAGALAFWEFHNLLFHARSRIGRHMGSVGGTYPHRGQIEPLPANKPVMSEEAFDLYKPDIERLRHQDRPFTDVLETRRSTRAFADPTISLHQLGEFLYRACRQRGEIDDGGPQQLTSRPYPGGGAVYELEIYLSVSACDGLAPGLYHYHAGEHRLFKLRSPSAAAEALLLDAAQSSQSNPQILLTIAARFGRIFWKYESMGYAAILKNVGVLYQTMYLVAEAMGLGACGIGGGHSDLLSNAAGLDYYAESAVGEFLIGTKADAD
jgi:SagB-type dehydrogenase family enzyme